jgi:hypothetical protein
VFTDGSERQVLQVPADFATIQQAVDAAEPGDVIMVAPGTYCEQVSITTSDLTLRAAPAVGNPAILSGVCETGGFGIHSHGISVTGVSGVLRGAMIFQFIGDAMLDGGNGDEIVNWNDGGLQYEPVLMIGGNGADGLDV